MEKKPDPVIKQFSDEQLEELAKDPNNIVYREKEGRALPPEEILPVDTVRKNLDVVRKLFVEFETTEGKDMSAKRCSEMGKRHILKKHPELKKFTQTHARIFAIATKKNLEKKEEETLYFMFTLFEQFQAGEVKDGKQALQDKVLQTFVVSEEEYKKVKVEQDLLAAEEERKEAKEKEEMMKLKREKREGKESSV